VNVRLWNETAKNKEQICKVRLVVVVLLLLLLLLVVVVVVLHISM